MLSANILMILGLALVTADPAGASALGWAGAGSYVFGLLVAALSILAD